MIKHTMPGSVLLSLALAVFLVSFAGAGLAAVTSVTISEAKWDSGRLVVKGVTDGRGTVTISNDGDDSIIGSTRSRGEWSFRQRLDVAPCKVRAEAGGSSDSKDVVDAGSNCDGGTPPPDINITDVTVDEGADSAVFTVSLSGSTTVPVSVEYATSNGSAAAGSDYTETSGTLTISAGNTSGTISVVIIDDTADESNETFNVTLSNAVNGNISDGQGVGTIVDNDDAAPPPPAPDVSINSTSQNSSEVGVDPYVEGPVAEAPFLGNSTHKVLAINDLGMHCGDLDTRIASILPPFQVLLAQVIERGGEPNLLDGTQAEVRYSAASNPDDPILIKNDVFKGVAEDGSVYKTNFWEVASQAYGPFYPRGILDLFYDPATPDLNKDKGLPVPNVAELYIGANGILQDGDEGLTAAWHEMPGVALPYVDNDPQQAREFYKEKPFFVNFPFGYVAEDLSWFEGAGIPFAAFDDFGRENAYPLVRVQALVGGNLVATTDTVLPISGEANCQGCHAAPADGGNGAATKALADSSIPIAVSIDDPQEGGSVPLAVSVEWASDINILRLHDLKHGTSLAAGFNETTGRADNPVVCQTCHYTPALDLAQLGPLGPENDGQFIIQGEVVSDSLANGRDQLKYKSMSNVMHKHHGSLATDPRFEGLDLFPSIAAPLQQADGSISNQPQRLAALEQNCYQCHPGKNVQCLRGAMFNGGMLCSDCHGSLEQVGDDFSRDVSPTNIGAFDLHGNFYSDATQPRVPWANEPGCGSCHTGDANDNMAGTTNTVVNTVDTNGNSDGIRLRQAFKTGDPKATPIVPSNKRFAEPAVPASFNGTPNNGAGNPQLYRVSTGHGGVMCEGCHGATHAEWPNGNPNANDNVTAKQLQGHTGTITDCDTCHVTSELPSDTQGGPHGMHLVNDSRFWREAHKDAAKQQNLLPGGGTCGSCHGSDHLGTVLSRAAEDRSFSVESRNRTVAAGEAVACDLCHSLEKSFSGSSSDD